MTSVRRVGERGAQWDVRDRWCIGCPCFSPGTYEHRGATLAGSRNTGSRTAECLHRAYYGCPESSGYVLSLERQRYRDGWRNV